MVAVEDEADSGLAIARLRQEHADLDAAIDAMLQAGGDQLQIQRMKKRKLAVRDRLQKLENGIIPDIIA